MRDELAKARAIAAAATPGPWGHNDGMMSPPVDAQDPTNEFLWVPVIHRNGGVSPRDAEHIARFDPPTVLAMLDAVEAAGKWHEVSMIPGNFTVKDTFASERDFIDKLARFYDLIGDNE